MYALTGYSWKNTDVSASFLPDGTSSEGYTSNLFSKLNGIAATSVWQREFARALQSWANVSPLNFHFVSDDGSATGTSGLSQGDSRFGDIRLGAHPLSNNYVAYTYFPGNWSTKSGDITISPTANYHIGSKLDLFSTLLHEAGHAIGLNHSLSKTVMYPAITGVYTGLSADDIAGIQAIYGARPLDAFDATSTNDTTSSAASIDVANGGASFRADLTDFADVDYYRFTAPDTTDGTLKISVDVESLSFLAPRLTLFDDQGQVIASVDAEYGANASLDLTGLTPGATYFAMVDGATPDEFGMGAYELNIEFGGNISSTTLPATTGDRFESNDSISSATRFGQIISRQEADLTLTDADKDVFHFSADKAGEYHISASSHDGLQLTLRLFDNRGRLLSTTSSSEVTVSLTRGQKRYIEVSGSDATTYDFSVERVTAISGGGALDELGDGLERETISWSQVDTVGRVPQRDEIAEKAAVLKPAELRDGKQETMFRRLPNVASHPPIVVPTFSLATTNEDEWDSALHEVVQELEHTTGKAN